MCTQLYEGNAFSLIVMCCVYYVEQKDIGIVIQSLGNISNILAVSVKEHVQAGSY